MIIQNHSDLVAAASLISRRHWRRQQSERPESERRRLTETEWHSAAPMTQRAAYR